ncbi:MAG: DNA repair protein RadA, partial [Patescibacteria group bacterium]
CSQCDAQFLKWTGRCLECGAWGTVSERAVATPASASGGSGPPSALTQGTPAAPTSFADVAVQPLNRITTRITEFDRVLGGGLVPGSLLLLGGEPGIGKSTIALQLAAALPSVLYCSGEESAAQIALRAKRLLTAPPPSLNFIESTHCESVIATIAAQKPTLAIIDSIQTIFSDQATGEAGGLAQMRVCTTQLLTAAKQTGTAILIIGHVTKEGTVAGPKTLEHLVDTVLYLEGDRFHEYRLLRAVKNRFGSTDEVGIFVMTEHGLEEVANPSAAFIKERGDMVAGSVLTCLVEGTRPLLVEIQALLTKTAFGYPQRRASGFDLNRLQILIAILQKRSGLNLAQYDIHLNVVGGIQAKEPAADLGVCLAIASAYKDKILSRELVAFGEVGLGGEVRPVSHTEKRIRECAQLGMKHIIAPASATTHAVAGITIVPVKNLEELILRT